MPMCTSASPTSARISRRAISRTRTRSRPSTRRRSRNGGRSSKAPASRRSDLRRLTRWQVRGERTTIAARLANKAPPMNVHAAVTAVRPQNIAPAEWEARVDLAALYRLVAHHGWDDVIFNHCSMRVPGESRKFLMKRHELLWTEVTASNLVKVDMDADLDEKSGVNRPGFTLHGGILRGRPDVNCAVHVHTQTGMAIAGLKSGLRMLSQEAVRFFGCIGYHPMRASPRISPSVSG